MNDEAEKPTKQASQRPITWRVDRAVLGRLAAIARAEDRSVNYVINRMLRECVENELKRRGKA
jgi:hypothetical protein